MILVDTHVLVWLDVGDKRLGSHAREQIDVALRGDALAVASISFWEVAMLVAKGRLGMSLDVHQWRNDLLSSGLTELPMDGAIGISAGNLAEFDGDPADRLIVVMAAAARATLITADRAILAWRGDVSRVDART